MKTIKKSFIVSLWFMLLTFPIMVIRVNTIEKVVEWRWANLAWVGLGILRPLPALALPAARSRRGGRREQEQTRRRPSDIAAAAFYRGQADLPAGGRGAGGPRLHLPAGLLHLSDQHHDLRP